jgi:hypothetical protein
VYDSRSERSVSSFDTPHVFNVVTLFELPFGQDKRWLNRTGVVNTLDGSLIKRFNPFKESSRRIEVRAEFFNLLNHRVLSQEGVQGDLFGAGGQNPLVTGADVPIPGVQNRFANLTAPGVWDALIARANGVATNVAIANLPGTGGALGVCNTTTDPGAVTTAVPGVPGSSTTRGSWSPACVASQLSLNGNFTRLQMNGVNSRIIQFALKLYF